MQNNKEFDELLQHLNQKNLDAYAKKHLSESKQRKLAEILSDKQKLSRLLDSDQAQQLMKKLKDKENGRR